MGIIPSTRSNWKWYCIVPSTLFHQPQKKKKSRQKAKDNDADEDDLDPMLRLQKLSVEASDEENETGVALNKLALTSSWKIKHTDPWFTF